MFYSIKQYVKHKVAGTRVELAPGVLEAVRTRGLAGAEFLDIRRQPLLRLGGLLGTGAHAVQFRL